MKQFHVYIMASRNGVLYVGMTNDLERRVAQHKTQSVPGFTSKYRVERLVFFEAFPTALQAIAAEKRIKGWRREKEIKLIESLNPTWRDLSEDWVEPDPPRHSNDRHPEGSGSDPRDLGAGVTLSSGPRSLVADAPRDDGLCEGAILRAVHRADTLIPSPSRAE